jgi:hypothetical protein
VRSRHIADYGGNQYDRVGCAQLVRSRRIADYGGNQYELNFVALGLPCGERVGLSTHFALLLDCRSLRALRSLRLEVKGSGFQLRFRVKG